MEFETLFLIISVVFLFFDLFQLSRGRGKRKLEQGFYGATLAFGLILIAYCLLLLAFATDNFALEEVYSYSSSSLSLVSKLAASWAGAGGSILLLAVLIGVVYFGFRLKMGKNAAPSAVAAAQVLCVFFIFFVLMAIGKNAFTRLDFFPPDGGGLNPALQTPWMMVHPPIVFAAYAFILLAFSLILGGMKTQDYAEGRLLKSSALFAWLLLTVGVALGGVWAYEVLGWGGYWAWDPVETGSLLVWLALTAYFLSKPLTSSGKTLVRPFLMLVTFLALIFLSALTRGGLRQSVHAYAFSPAGPLLLGLGLGVAVYFFYLKKRTGKALLALNIQRSSIYSVSAGLAVFSLIFLFLVSFIGVITPIVEQLFTANPLIPGIDFYNNWSYPFAFLFVLAIIGRVASKKLGVKQFAAVAISCVIAGAALAVVQWPTSVAIANAGVPVLFVALVLAAVDVAASLSKNNRGLQSFGRRLFYLGIVVALFGILFSSAAKQSTSFSLVSLDSSGVTPVDALGTRVLLHNFTVYMGSGQVYYAPLDSVQPEHSALKMDVTIERNSATYTQPMWIYLYTNYAAMGPMSQPLIISTTEGDIYMHFDVNDATYTQTFTSLSSALIGVELTPQAVAFTIQIVPLIYLLWIGIIVMCVGTALEFASSIGKKHNVPIEEV